MIHVPGKLLVIIQGKTRGFYQDYSIAPGGKKSYNNFAVNFDNSKINQNLKGDRYER